MVEAYVQMVEAYDQMVEVNDRSSRYTRYCENGRKWKCITNTANNKIKIRLARLDLDLDFVFHAEYADKFPRDEQQYLLVH